MTLLAAATTSDATSPIAPWAGPLDRLITVNVQMPPSVDKLAKRIDAGIDKVIEAAWMDGAMTGATWAAIALIVLWIVVQMIRGKAT